MPHQPDSTCIIHLDTSMLDHAAAFWKSILAYEETSRTANSTPIERRLLHSDAFPQLDIELVSCDPRPTVGSTLGSLRSLTFKVSDPVNTARQAQHALWVQEIDPAEPTPDSILLIDPSGYRVRLVRSS